MGVQENSVPEKREMMVHGKKVTDSRGEREKYSARERQKREKLKNKERSVRKVSTIECI